MSCLPTHAKPSRGVQLLAFVNLCRSSNVIATENQAEGADWRRRRTPRNHAMSLAREGVEERNDRRDDFGECHAALAGGVAGLAASHSRRGAGRAQAGKIPVRRQRIQWAWRCGRVRPHRIICHDRADCFRDRAAPAGGASGAGGISEADPGQIQFRKRIRGVSGKRGEPAFSGDFVLAFFRGARKNLCAGCAAA